MPTKKIFLKKNSTTSSLIGNVLTAIIASWSVGFIITWPLWYLMLFGDKPGLILFFIPIMILSFNRFHKLSKDLFQSPQKALWVSIITLGVVLLLVQSVLGSLLSILPFPYFILEGGILDYASVIFILLLMSDKMQKSNAMKKLVISTATITLILIILEVVFVFALRSIESGSDLKYAISLVKILLYGPIIWGTVVYSVNKSRLL